MTGVTTIHVIVPARNEERLIGRCLSSIRIAEQHLARVAVDVEVALIVVLDRCHDDTARIARRHGARIVSSDAGVVGTARRIGVAAALACMESHAPVQHWVANTDADSAVPPDWLWTHLDLADRGTHVVTGLVVPDHGLTAHQQFRWHTAHPVRSGHAHVFGANLGIRADTYSAIGGFAPMTSGEDRALVDAARAAGAVVVATDRGIVLTSPRRGSRAPDGFAHWLHTAHHDEVRNNDA